jgi:hypothetical protein
MRLHERRVPTAIIKPYRHKSTSVTMHAMQMKLRLGEQTPYCSTGRLLLDGTTRSLQVGMPLFSVYTTVIINDTRCEVNNGGRYSNITEC